MNNFNPNKCYIEKIDNSNIVSDYTPVNYYFQLFSSFLYLLILFYLFFISNNFLSHSVGRNGIRFFLLYYLGVPNLKIFLNTLFVKKLKIDYTNGLIFLNNKPLSIERVSSINITEICPYHYSWRWGQTQAFNLSFYKKSVITLKTDFGDIKFYICSEKALNMLIKLFEKFEKDYSTMYDERRLWFTFY